MEGAAAAWRDGGLGMRACVPTPLPGRGATPNALVVLVGVGCMGLLYSRGLQQQGHSPQQGSPPLVLDAPSRVPERQRDLARTRRRLGEWGARRGRAKAGARMVTPGEHRPNGDNNYLLGLGGDGWTCMLCMHGAASAGGGGGERTHVLLRGHRHVNVRRVWRLGRGGASRSRRAGPRPPLSLACVAAAGGPYVTRGSQAPFGLGVTRDARDDRKEGTFASLV